MSRQFTLISLVAAVIFLIGFSFLQRKFYFFPQERVQSFSHKESLLQLKRSPVSSLHTAKLKSSLQLKLKMGDKDFQMIPHQPFTLVAEIVTEEEMKDLRVRWALPPGVTVIEGELESKIVDLLPNTPQILSLTLSVPTSDNQQIHLMVDGERYGTHFGEVAQINTQDQQLIEMNEKELVQKSKTKSEEKVFH